MELYDQFYILFDPEQHQLDINFIEQCEEENDITIQYFINSDTVAFQIIAPQEWSYDNLKGIMKLLYNKSPHNCHELTKWGAACILDK
jgi:hypothetical protein